MSIKINFKMKLRRKIDEEKSMLKANPGSTGVRTPSTHGR